MDGSHFVCHSSPADRHLGYFSLLAVMNNAAINTHAHIFCVAYIFNSLGCIPRSGNAGS